MFKVNNKNTRMRSITSFWSLIVNFEHISDLFLVFLLLTLKKQISPVYIMYTCKTTTCPINLFHVTVLFTYPILPPPPPKKKKQKHSGFFKVSGNIENDQWHEMGQSPLIYIIYIIYLY